MSNAISQLFKTGVGNLSLKLGDIEFGHAEIPEKINFGGDQGLHIHQLIGGTRIVHTTGANDHNQTWSGMFMGSTALERAQFIDTMRSEGNQHLLVYGEQQYIVVIQSFRPHLERTYQIPYEIELVIVNNLTLPVTDVAVLGYDDAEQADLATALSLADLIANGTLITQIEAIGIALNDVGQLTGATQPQINSISNSITSAQLTTESLISSTEQELGL